MTEKHKPPKWLDDCSGDFNKPDHNWLASIVTGWLRYVWPLVVLGLIYLLTH